MKRATHACAEALKNLKKKIRTECPLLGKRVEVTGTSRGDLDGKFGVAASFDHERGRYAVAFERQTGKAVPLSPRARAQHSRQGHSHRQGR